MITIKRAYLELEHEGVIVTAAGPGDVRGRRREPQPQPAEQELDVHLARAAEVGARLGLTATELAARLREAIRQKATSGAKG